MPVPVRLQCAALRKKSIQLGNECDQDKQRRARVVGRGQKNADEAIGNVFLTLRISHFDGRGYQAVPSFGVLWRTGV
jgi:hypothetical protein